jgi:hypothetical protein
MSEASRRSGLRLPAACSLLAVTLALAAALGSSVALERHGALAATAVLAAAATCWASATSALVLAARLSGTRWGVQGIMAAGFIRFTLPLMVVAASALVQGPLARAGLFGYMVAFFLLSLVVETLLLVGVIRSSDTSHGVAWKGL